MEWAKAQKAEKEALKHKGPTTRLTGNESLGSLKKLGFKIGNRSN
nr:MAG TPA: hypothetical protein [Caudoviricetes sp.]